MLVFKKWLYSLSSKRVATVIAGVIVAGLVMLGNRIGFQLTEQAQAGLTMFVVNMIAAIWSDTNRSFHSSESILGFNHLVGVAFLSKYFDQYTADGRFVFNQ